MPKKFPIQRKLTKPQQQMVEENVPLVIWLAEKLWDDSVKQMIYGSRDDMIQTGIIGLINAARLYNPKLGIKFSTYATRAIWREISNKTRRQFVMKSGINPATSLKWSYHIDDLCEQLTARGDGSTVRDDCDRNELIRQVHAAISRLPERTADIVRKHIGIDNPPMQFNTIAKCHGISSERVRQLYSSGCRLLRIKLRAFNCAA